MRCSEAMEKMVSRHRFISTYWGGLAAFVLLVCLLYLLTYLLTHSIMMLNGVCAGRGTVSIHTVATTYTVVVFRGLY